MHWFRITNAIADNLACNEIAPMPVYIFFKTSYRMKQNPVLLNLHYIPLSFTKSGHFHHSPDLSILYNEDTCELFHYPGDSRHILIVVGSCRTYRDC